MRFNRLRSLFQKLGARSVFLPRLPLPRLKARGSPLLPSGTRNRPSTLEVVKVRRLPVKRKRYALFVSTGRVLKICDLISPSVERLRQEFIFLNLSEFSNCSVSWLT